MSKSIEELKAWIETQEKISLPPESEEEFLATLETEELLALSDQLEAAYNQFMEKMNHVNS